ncbi:MAG: lipid A biosynthesis lauroyl acyltransferase [Hydrogenophilales bacterium CG17_big_fil_post_rev_8_21_14_2_50_63_12]|nr:MAG: lipid A biosynthesis lauroyl acyltransferase [Hydrogenophilales bacterium CG17_big_fil_post_rev_8_21_14_2_50_63_12]PIX97612.1 MAG: lipid A biosynthesis lauroyl acyltransferase [Hydrogenophilales bacterium CG_4_10_14_3_um_filter_63_21]PJB03710.1 MAG: lipid A biosynthesis lauroyl acyltransferase [Hydrogenophilales bacterium CG_4_9_14_3_um_filter_63_34]
MVKPVLLFFLRLFSRLPLPVAHGLGAMLGLLGLLRRRHRELLRDNLKLTGLYRPLCLIRAGMELGKGLAELPLVWLAPLPRVFSLIREVRGWEHIEVELRKDKGRGIALLAPHLGCWEIGGIFISNRLPVTALYTPPRQAWVHEMMRYGRERAGAKTVPPTAGGVRALLGKLKAGEATFILPDQSANRGEGLWIRFLGHPAYLPSLPYRLIASTQAVPLIVFAERLTWGRGFRLHIEPLPVAPTDSAETLAHIANQAISKLIRQHPEQYLWSYRLFRHHADVTPPEDLP